MFVLRGGARTFLSAATSERPSGFSKHGVRWTSSELLRTGMSALRRITVPIRRLALFEVECSTWTFKPEPKAQFMLNRRSFFSAAACVGASVALGAEQQETSSPAGPKKRIKLGIATYSYWHFKTEKVPIETVIEKSAEIGVEGLDILHRQ